MNLLFNYIIALYLIKIYLCQSNCSQNWYCALSSETKEITILENGFCDCKCCQSLVLNICSVCLETGQINLVSEGDCHDYACSTLCEKMSSCETNCKYDNNSECFFADLICRNFDSSFVVKTEYSNYRTVCGKTALFFTQLETTFLDNFSYRQEESTTKTNVLGLNQSNYSINYNKINFFSIFITFLITISHKSELMFLKII